MTTPNIIKRSWKIFISAMPILTPLIVLFLGFYFDKSLTKIEGQIKNVEAMQPFTKMIADKDVTTSKMGAYAIYMLKKDDDPQMAAQMILAPGQPHLFDVLWDIGKRDSIVYGVIQRVMQDVDTGGKDPDSVKNISEMERYALKLINNIDNSDIKFTETIDINAIESDPTDASIPGSPAAREKLPPDGWLYLGTKNALISNKMPNLKDLGTEIYKLKKAVNLRTGKPQPPDYRNKNFIRVVENGSEFKIDTFTVDRKRNVWASVRIQ